MNAVFAGSRLHILALSVCLVTGFAWSPVIADSSWFRVKNVRPGSVVWVRSGPAVTYKRIGFLKAGSRHIRSLGCQKLGRSEWCNIIYRGTEGWVSKRYLAKDTRFKA